MKKQLCFFF